MKKILCAAALIGLFSAGLVSCKKDDKKTTTPTPPATESPYYFEFTLDGKYTKFANPEPQYASLFGDVGGWQTPANALSPGIRLAFLYTHSATNADVMGLKGKRLRFNDTYDSRDSVLASLSYDTDDTSGTYYDTSDTTFDNYVEISNISYLKREMVIGSYNDLYVITGTCKTQMQRGMEPAVMLEGGKFNMVISRLVLDGE
ncbi:MAG: hypothetical protein QM743_14265 [Chitinophagaceae bacterium]